MLPSPLRRSPSTTWSGTSSPGASPRTSG
eukprot:SM013592S00012  [mRNA]  locus=s13592:165:248:- [translate_table: standard]